MKKLGSKHEHTPVSISPSVISINLKVKKSRTPDPFFHGVLAFLKSVGAFCNPAPIGLRFCLPYTKPQNLIEFENCLTFPKNPVDIHVQRCRHLFMCAIPSQD